MAIIQWSEDFKIGEKEIDKEHWGLFALINDLDDKRAQGAGESSIKSTLMALVAYVDVHFEHEERLMEETGYPDLEDHKKIHKALGSRVDRFRVDYEGSPEAFDYVELMEFLSSWLSEHILRVDMRFSEFLKKQRAETKAEA